MAQQTVDTGAAPDDGNGDPLRTAMTKINSNFTELYARVEIVGEEQNYADLVANQPVASHTGEYWFVYEEQGSKWFLNYKEAGVYRSNGTTWVYMGAAIAAERSDSSWELHDNTTDTKRVGFELSGGTASTKTTIATSQTTNKTITTPDKTGTLMVGSGATADEEIARFSGTDGEVIQGSTNNTLNDQGHLKLKGTQAAIDLAELSASPASQAATGHFWVKDDVPSRPKFTDDTGAEVYLDDTGGDFLADGTVAMTGNFNINTQSIEDANSNELLKFGTTASAVNDVTVTNGATGSGPTISATGDDTDIDLKLTSKGAGEVFVDTSLRVDHTSTHDDDHAVEIDVDAAGNADVKAIDVVYTTGALASGEDDAVILVNIDETAATGGEIVALEVLSTEGSADGAYAIKAGAVVGPVLQDSGTFANPTTGTNNTTGPADVNDMIDGSTGTSTTIFVADNDYILIGAAAAFSEIEFILQTPVGNPGVTPTFGYSTAGAHQFQAFVPVDGTNGFQNSGVVAWETADLTSWVTNDDTGTYDIKITRTHNSKGSVSLYYAKTAVTVVYSWDKDGDVSIKNLQTAEAIELGHATDTTIERVSAGVASIQGVNIVTTSSTDTLTNKTFDANGTGNSFPM